MTTPQIQIIVQQAQGTVIETINVPMGAAAQGQTLRLKAQQGQRFQLKLLSNDQQTAPDNVKVDRVGQDLHIKFLEDEEAADVILEGYYDVVPDGFAGLVGEANGVFYEYAAIGTDASLAQLAQGTGNFYSVLGGVEVAATSGAALGALAFNPLLAALGAVGAAGAAAGGGGGDAPVQNIVKGRLVAGPVIEGHDVTVTLYDLAGNVLGSQLLDPQGNYEINIGSYTGGIVAKVTDPDNSTADDYFDEGLRANKDLDSVLMAVNVVVGANSVLILNINEATTAAAVLLGLNPVDGSGSIVANDPLAAILSANATLAAIVGVVGSLTAADAQSLYNTDGTVNPDFNSLGIFLAALSGMALNTSPTTSAQAISVFVEGINPTNNTLDGITQARLILGAVKAGVERSVITEALQPDSPADATEFLVDHSPSIRALTPAVAANLTAEQATAVLAKVNDPANPIVLDVPVLMVLLDAMLSASVNAGVALTAAQSTLNTAKAVLDALVDNWFTSHTGPAGRGKKSTRQSKRCGRRLGQRSGHRQRGSGCGQCCCQD